VSFAKAAPRPRAASGGRSPHSPATIESLVLQNGELPLPSIVLVVSAATPACTSSSGQARTQLLSRTRDDAAGEAYDKVAKLLASAIPVDRKVAPGESGNDRAVALPATRLDARRPGTRRR